MIYSEKKGEEKHSRLTDEITTRSVDATNGACLFVKASIRVAS